jgi:TonB family protein
VALASEDEAKLTAAERPTWRVAPLVIAALVLVALGWAGYRALSVQEVARKVPPRVEAPSVAPPATTTVPGPVEPSPAKPAAVASPSVNQVLPSISQSSLDTIRGTLRVSVRLRVGKDGTVIAATADDPGPSPYFERRSLEASKKWTFAPAESDAPRSMRVRFAFTRSGVTASAEPLRSEAAGERL